MKQKVQPKFITIVRPWSPISWFNPLIGKTFKVLKVSSHDFAEVEYKKGFKGWIPIECCEKHFFRPKRNDIKATESHSNVVAEAEGELK